MTDYWTVSSTSVVRHHVVPRMELYVTNESECPIPLRYLDVVRITMTNLEERKEAYMEDVWIPEAPMPEDTRLLSGEWTGKTIFRILRPEPPPGHMWHLDRLVKCKQTTRPDDVDPILWTTLSTAQRATAIAEWQKVETVRANARSARGTFFFTYLPKKRRNGLE